MYYRHFGLSDQPFQFTARPRLLFLSEGHRESAAALEWGLMHEPSGFTLLVGETGTGKTTLVMSILARKYDQIRTVYVSNPKLGFDGILHELIRQLGIESPPVKFAMLEAFDHFVTGLERDERVVIVVDEAQSLDDEALEELRLFANRGRADQKQLGLVLVGQPQLLRRLMRPELRQFNDCIGARAVLNPLKREEALDYVEYWLNMCGSNAARVFSRGALAYIVGRSGGIPRRINLLCHNAMLIAYACGQREVDLRSARAAVAEYENPLAGARRFDGVLPWARFWRACGLLAGVMALGFFAAIAEIYLGASRGNDEALAAPESSTLPEITAPASAATTASAPLFPSSVPASASETATPTKALPARHRLHRRRRHSQYHRPRASKPKEHFSIWRMLVGDWPKRS